MWEWYKKWRHTRGYGVHSPFAYDMVKYVVRPPRGYSWYGYTDIDNDLDNDRGGKRLRHVRRQARMLLRLASWLDIKSAYLPKDDPSTPYYAALRAVRSDMRVTSAMAEMGKCRLVASNGDFVGLDLLCKSLQEPGRVVVVRDVPEGWTDRLFDALPEGVMFCSGDAVILVHRPQMQKVRYSVRL